MKNNLIKLRDDNLCSLIKYTESESWDNFSLKSFIDLDVEMQTQLSYHTTG